MAYQISTVHLQPLIKITGNGQTFDISKFVQGLRIVKTLATWFTEIHIKLQLPYRMFSALIPLKDCKLDITLKLYKNDHLVDNINFQAIVFMSDINNTLNKEEPIDMLLITVPVSYNALVKSTEFYSEDPITNKQIINQIISTFDISDYEVDSPTVTKQYNWAFIPYMPKIIALAYACREFGYSKNIYHAYIDLDKFKLFNWDVRKYFEKQFILTLFPKRADITKGMLQTVRYVERTDITRRVDMNSFVEQHSWLINGRDAYYRMDTLYPMYDAKSVIDIPLFKAIYDTQFIDIQLIYDGKLFIANLLDPIEVKSNVAEFLPLKGLYCVTDMIVQCDFTQSTFVPYTILRISKRD